MSSELKKKETDLVESYKQSREELKKKIITQTFCQHIPLTHEMFVVVVVVLFYYAIF